ncbi:ABC transporter ATP-binding protein [Candidatus Marinamargulisbacteria bacterium SCGC AG-410-N11]|nr:ABC transporter ATP-binding protein [Candidatus Marinamargulisbacteria bacterium SCGC AG-410-N11]
MILLSVQNLSYSVGSKDLYKDVSFGIEEGDKIALVGINGSGKSTLLNQIVDFNQSDQNNVKKKKGLSVSYLSQDISYHDNDTILDYLFCGHSPVALLIKDYQACLDQLSREGNQDLTDRLANLSTKMDLANAWEYQDRVRSILKELNISNLNQRMSDLSGGMRKKVRLAQVFFEDSDLIILDEPTNHLDIPTIEWLESMLVRYHKSLLMVTHDRYFLDNICNRILEIDNQKVFKYKGNYQSYLAQREQRYQAVVKADQRTQSILRVELQWLKRGPKARSTKQKARKDRIETLMSQDRFSPDKVLNIEVEGRRLGKKVLSLKNVSKSFDDKQVLNEFCYTFKQRERIGIIGPNGVGKTTLLKIITEQIKPDSGEIDCGINTVFGYFDQTNDVLDPDQTIFEHVNEIGSAIKLANGQIVSASKMLERFLFPSNTLKTPVGKLSGGEKRRLQLVCMLLKNPNFLLFDEPTNDLDIITLSILEDFLLEFSGCTIIVSHDRYFMDRVVDSLFVFDQNSAIQRFMGSYTDYIDTLKDINSIQKEKDRQNQHPQVKKSNQWQTKDKPSIKKKMTYKEKIELQEVEIKLETLETKKKQLTESLYESKTAINFEDVGKELKTIEQELDRLYERWEYLIELSS